MTRWVLSLFLIVFSSVSHSSAKANECVISFAVSNDFPPFHSLNDEQQWHGIAVDLAHALVEGAGCELELLNIPWIRALDMLKKGELSMMPHITAKPSREKAMHFVGPMALEQIVFIARSNLAHDVKVPADLADFPALIGKNLGTQYNNEIERLVKGAKVRERVVETVSDANKIEMFQLHRLGGIFEERAVAEHFFHNNILDPEQYQISLTFTPTPVYFGLSTVAIDEAMLNRLRQAWNHIVAKDKVAQIYTLYGVSAPDLSNGAI